MVSINQLIDLSGPHLAGVDDSLAKLAKNGVVVNPCEGDFDHLRENTRLPYLTSLRACIEERFPNLPVLSVPAVFQPERIPKAADALASCGLDEIDVLINATAEEKLLEDTTHQPLSDATLLMTQWLAYKSLISSSQHLHTIKSVQGLLQVLNRDHLDKLGEIVKLADWGVAIPLSTADCKWDFSHISLVKTSHRNQLGNTNLERLLRIKIDGPPLTAFPFTKALLKWHGMSTV